MSLNQKKPNLALDPASFRDPDGFIFYHQGRLYRQINVSYLKKYQKLASSGLLAALHRQKLLIPHQEVNPQIGNNAYKVIQPEVVPFITYPYSWCFSELKDAALLTLEIQALALAHGMSLKDASAYNIQFHHGRPILIDTLSFETYHEGEPWVAYRQYCQHFLAPLALMSYTDIRLNKLFRIFMDGIPLDLASRLLSKKTYFNGGLATHIHLHAKTQQKYAHTPPPPTATNKRLNKISMLGLIDNLRVTTQKLTWKHSPQDTEWGDYYNITNYSKKALDHKKQIITQWIKRIKPTSVWDLGANDGRFSRIASHMGISTVAFDIDPVAVEKNYLAVKHNHDRYMLPLVVDLTNPPPSLGWANSERKNLLDRGPADMVLALAIIHHLSIGNNVPLPQIAAFMARIGNNIVIEFVPKSDSNFQKLLTTRKDVFPQYNLKQCMVEFSSYFTLIKKVNIKESKRSLLLFSRKR